MMVTQAFNSDFSNIWLKGYFVRSVSPITWLPLSLAASLSLADLASVTFNSWQKSLTIVISQMRNTIVPLYPLYASKKPHEQSER